MKKSEGGSTAYYELPVNATEICDLIEFRNMNFNMGNIFKAAWRFGQEESGNTKEYELKKIIFFAFRELNTL